MTTLYRCKAPTDLVCRCGKVARRLRAAGVEFDEVRVQFRRRDRPEIEELTGQLAEARKQSEDYLDRLRRSMAEFDNYRKRTEKEKEQERTKGILEVVSAVLPLLDNFERALASIPEEEKESAVAKGVEMMYQQFVAGLTAIGVKEIPALGEPFDPNKHNAVTHIEDESMDENIVCEVFQKGYSYKDQVVRYSMVKVAN